MMKKAILILLIVLAAAVRLPAEKTAEVSLRFSRQDALVRVVVETDDEMLKNAGVSTSLSEIRIDFPAQFQVVKPKDFPYVVVKRDRSLMLNLQDVDEIKTSRLTAPARLVFDLTTPQKQQGEILSQKLARRLLRPNIPPASFGGPVVSPSPGRETGPRPGQTQQPLAHPGQPSEKTEKIDVIVLDPGHGGYDYGIISEDAREKDVNLSLARDLSAAMSKKGLTVFLDRRVDQSTSLAERIHFANAKRPDLLISIHAASWNGFAVYVAASEDLNADAAVRLYSVSSRQSRYIAKSRELARAIAVSLTQEFHADVVLRELPLPVLTSLNAPAVMIDYPSPKFFVSDKMRAKFAASVLKGISTYAE